MRSTCSECTSTSSECMWCSNMKQCVDSNAYVASFPFGQCMEWYTMNSCPRKSCSSSRSSSFRFHTHGPSVKTVHAGGPFQARLGTQPCARERTSHSDLSSDIADAG